MKKCDFECDSAATATSLPTTPEDLCALAKLSPQQIVQACRLTEVKAVAIRLEEELRQPG